MMFGQIEEVYQALHHNGEIEFDYKNTAYVIQSEVWKDNKAYLVIWTAYFYKENICLYREEVPEEGLIDKNYIDRALNAKCFDGKSFLEIANDVELTTIYGAD